MIFYGLQLSFQEWTQQMKDMLDARKRGDQAFREKDFKTAIDCYSQVLLTLLVLYLFRTFFGLHTFAFLSSLST